MLRTGGNNASQHDIAQDSIPCYSLQSIARHSMAGICNEGEGEAVSSPDINQCSSMPR